MKIPPQSFACLLWSYRYNAYKRRGWSDGLAAYFAGINASAVYIPVLAAISIALLELLRFLLKGFSFHVHAILVIAIVMVPWAYYESSKKNIYRAVCQSMNSPGSSVLLVFFLYLGSLMVPMLLAIAIRAKPLTLLISYALYIPLSAFIADHWAAGQIRKLQAAHTAEQHGKHASR